MNAWTLGVAALAGLTIAAIELEHRWRTKDRVDQPDTDGLIWYER